MKRDPGETMAKKKERQRPVGRLSKELMDRLVEEAGGEEALRDPGALLRELTGALVERALEAEVAHHLGYEAGEAPPEGQTNRRNGKGRKRLRTNQGEVEVRVPRDREGSFEPKLVPKRQRHFDGFDDKILAMYARGMSVRDIRAQLEELYGTSVSPDLISRVTDSVMDELRAWQQRALEPVYCIVYVDAIRVKVRAKGRVVNQAVYTVLGVTPHGDREVLGLWLQETEGAKFWCAIFDELRRRGVRDILVMCADGLTGIGDAAAAVFPEAVYQTCIVHVIRAATRYVPWKDRRAVCAALRPIYTAQDADTAAEALDAFEDAWGARYPMALRTWRDRWADIIPFLAYPEEIRRAIYTTNAVEAVHRLLRKALKTRGALPSGDAAIKLLYLALRYQGPRAIRKQRDWHRALCQFAIHFEGRLPQC